MFIDILKSLIAGIIAAAPFGPVLVLVLQKTMRHGRWAGFCTGLGSSLADTIYAAIGLFTLGLISTFIQTHQEMMYFIGGSVLLVVGILVWRKDSEVVADIPETHFTKAGYGVQACFCALSNPTALAFMMALLFFLKLDSVTIRCPIWLSLLAVFAGETFYWFVVTGVVNRYVHLKPRYLKWMSTIAGIGVSVIGIFLIVKGIIMICNG